MVYVDRIQKTRIPKREAWLYYSYCHLTADTIDELIEFADKINLKREWLQESRNGTKHFDITSNKRKQAIKLGANEK